MKIIGTVGVLFTLIVFELATKSHALYADPSEKTSAKVINPDPLYAVESDLLPMIHNNDFDTIMPDSYDQYQAASMQYQNFEEFYEPLEQDNTEYKMDETQFVRGTVVRAPQPLSPEERMIREQVHVTSAQHEQQKQRKLKKGSTKPFQGKNQWDQFDYDMYIGVPEKNKKGY